MSVIGTKYRGTPKYQVVYCRLLMAARRKEEVLYPEIAKLLGIGQAGHHMAREVGQVLGEISEDEHKVGRPMLSAIAVSVRGLPGEGFFTTARRLGKLSATGANAEVTFWMGEERKVYQAWQPIG